MHIGVSKHIYEHFSQIVIKIKRKVITIRVTVN